MEKAHYGSQSNLIKQPLKIYSVSYSKLPRGGCQGSGVEPAHHKCAVIHIRLVKAAAAAAHGLPNQRLNGSHVEGWGCHSSESSHSLRPEENVTNFLHRKQALPSQEMGHVS